MKTEANSLGVKSSELHKISENLTEKIHIMNELISSIDGKIAEIYCRPLDQCTEEVVEPTPHDMISTLKTKVNALHNFNGRLKNIYDTLDEII